MKKEFDEVDAMKGFDFASEDAERFIKEVRHDVYKALADVSFKHFANCMELEEDDQKEVMKQAVEYFMQKFYE